jgi:hypothetical protein
LNEKKLFNSQLNPPDLFRYFLNAEYAGSSDPGNHR